MNLHGGRWRSVEVRGGLRGGPWRLHGGLHGGPRRSAEVSMEVDGASTNLHRDLYEPSRTSTDLHGDLHGASTLYKEYLVHQYSFKLKGFNCLYLLFFKSFHGFYLIFAHSIHIHIYIYLTYSRWTSSLLPSCLWSQRIFLSLPGSRLTIFYRDASSALLQLVS